jgi:CshA-type fibril repeat protein
MNKNFSIPSRPNRFAAYSQCWVLESRMVFDGAVVATAVDAQAQAQTQTQTQDTASNQPGSENIGATAAVPDAPVVDFSPKDTPQTISYASDTNNSNNQPSFPVADNALAPTGSASVTGENLASPTNIIVVDPRAENAAFLSANPPANTQVMVLDSTRDGFQQIAEQLQTRHNVTQLDILPWTQDGQQWLGSKPLTATLEPSVSNSLTSWNDGLATDARLVFHGQNSMNTGWQDYVSALTGAQTDWLSSTGFTQTDTSLSVNSSAIPTTVYFIDSAVQNPADIVSGLDPNAEIVYLDATKDGLTQIADYLAGRTGIDSIQIISHASQATLLLGNELLTNDNLTSHADQLAAIGQSLSSGGDILLYGCDLAQSTNGSLFVDSFAYLTQADVAASTDLTGAAGKGGNWTLEYTAGTIEASILAASHYQDILALPTFDVTGLALSFNNPAVVKGVGLNTGDIIVFNNVVTVNGQAIDAIVTIMDSTGIAITGLDTAAGSLVNPNNPPASISLNANWFELNTNVTAAGGSSTIKFDFILNGTYNPAIGDGTDVLLQNVTVNSYDVDNSQFQDFSGFSSYALSGAPGSAFPTTLAVTGSGNFTHFVDTTSNDNTDTPATNLSVFNQARVTAIYNEINTFQIKTGSNITGPAFYYLDFSTGPTLNSPSTLQTYDIPTANPLTTHIFTPTLTGTYAPNVTGSTDTAQTLAVTVNGVTYTSANGLVWSGGTWSLNIPPANALLPGTYDVAVNTGYGPNAGTVTVHTIDRTVDELVVINDPPVNTVPGDQIVNPGVPSDIPGLSATDLNNNLASTQLSVALGVLTVDLSGGATIIGGANGTGSLILGGTEAQIKAALATVKYTANNGTTSDTLSVLSTDKLGLTDLDTIAININRPPIAVDDNVSGVPNTPVTINVLNNDSDPDNNLNPATIKIVGTANPGDPLVVPGEGTWSVNLTTGEITFTPVAGFTGSPTPINYTVKDTLGLESPPALVSITVDNPPVANPDTVRANPGTPVTINVLNNDSDPDNNLNPATVKIVGTANPGDPLVVPGEGTWSVNLTTGEITFTPVAGFTGSPTPINYTVKDTSGLESGLALVSITVDNPPVANPDTVTAEPGRPVTINILGNDSDPDNNLNPATVKIVGTANPGDPLVVPGEGTWSVNLTTGEITFTPVAGFTGSPTPINYTVKDTSGLESPAAKVTVNVPSVIALLDSPIANNLLGTTGSLILLSNPTLPLFTFFDPPFNPPIRFFDDTKFPIFKPVEFARPVDLRLYIPSPNDIISLTGSLRDQVVLELKRFSFDIPSWSFRHTNPNAQLEFEATRTDGSSLPEWLQFNPKLLRFSGIPPKGAHNEEVMVTVRDTYGNEVHAIFSVHVNKERARFDQKSLAIDSKLLGLSDKVLEKSHKEKPVAGKTKSGLSERIHATGKLGKLQESRALLDSLNAR